MWLSCSFAVTGFYKEMHRQARRKFRSLALKSSQADSYELAL